MGTRHLALVLACLASVAACSDDPVTPAVTPDGGTGGDTGTDSGTPFDASQLSDGSVPPPPATTCAEPAKLVDVSKPTTVVGTGTPGSCTPQLLATAVAAGGVVTFDCGAAPTTITVASELTVTKDTTLDGGGTVTLSGGKKTRILHLKSAWNVPTPQLTVQKLTFTDGFTTDVPNTKSTAQGGAAIFEDGGSLTVIDCTFVKNQCASTGQDVSGGAINGQGVGALVIQGSTFEGNSGSNGGAVGTQAENVTVVNSTFSNNAATGTDGNPGNGGDGGALTYDGKDNSLTLCGDTFTGNHANAQGGAVFRVAYGSEPTNVDRCTFDGNSVDTTTGLAGGLYLEHTVITMSGTTISGNAAHYGGGIWVGQSAVALFTNVTISGNTAELGAGVWFAGGITGTLLNCTVAGNQKEGLFGGDTGVKLQNSIVANNSSYSCEKVHGSAPPNIVFPGSPGTCTSDQTVADPVLGPLMDNGGPTKTMLPGPGSPAIGKGAACPGVDQRGEARASACTLGAAEAK